MLVLMINANQR